MISDLIKTMIDMVLMTVMTIIIATILQLPMIMFMSGPKSELPAAGVAGRLYYATDTHELLRDNGTNWEEIAPHASYA